MRTTTRLLFLYARPMTRKPLGAIHGNAAFAIRPRSTSSSRSPPAETDFNLSPPPSETRSCSLSDRELARGLDRKYDRLRASRSASLAETQLRIVHCLIGHPGGVARSRSPRRRRSGGARRCRRFTDRPNVEAVVAYDTAGSVMDLMRDGAETSTASNFFFFFFLALLAGTYC